MGPCLSLCLSVCFCLGSEPGSAPRSPARKMALRSTEECAPEARVRPEQPQARCRDGRALHTSSCTRLELCMPSLRKAPLRAPTWLAPPAQPFHDSTRHGRNASGGCNRQHLIRLGASCLGSRGRLGGRLRDRPSATCRPRGSYTSTGQGLPKQSLVPQTCRGEPGVAESAAAAARLAAATFGACDACGAAADTSPASVPTASAPRGPDTCPFAPVGHHSNKHCGLQSSFRAHIYDDLSRDAACRHSGLACVHPDIQALLLPS